MKAAGTHRTPPLQGSLWKIDLKMGFVRTPPPNFLETFLKQSATHNLPSYTRPDCVLCFMLKIGAVYSDVFP